MICIRCKKLIENTDTKTCENCIAYIENPWFVRDVIALTLVLIVRDIIVVIDVGLLFIMNCKSKPI